jgi:hypothetical protein
VLPSNGATIAEDLAGAEKDFAYANAALRQGDLATYAQDIAAAEALVADATKLAGTGATTTTTTVPGGHGTGGHGTRTTTSGTTTSTTTLSTTGTS